LYYRIGPVLCSILSVKGDLNYGWFGFVRFSCLGCVIFVLLGQQRLPDLLKLVRRLHAKKRQSMLQVSARLGISVDTDKPAILARSSAKAVPTRYAFPASSTQNSGKPTCLLPKASIVGYIHCMLVFKALHVFVPPCM